MRLYEFETKALMLNEGIAVPYGTFTNNPAKVAEFVEEQGKSVVKAQALVGRRMEAGGIRFVKVPVQGELAAEMLFDTEIHGEEVIGVLVEKFIPIENEYYISFYYQSEHKSLVMAFSLESGIQIETTLPENIYKIDLPLNQDVEWRLRNFLLNIFGKKDKGLLTILKKLYDFFLKYEFTLLEINPMVMDENNEFLVVDVVALLDSTALGRHPEIMIAPRVSRRKYSSPTDFKNSIINIEDSRGLRSDFVYLGGDIATLSMGGFMSLAVVDYIRQLGGNPYNFAEVRGNAPSVRIIHMLKTFLNNDRIKGLLIVGSALGNPGLDSVANGIRNALKEIRPAYPIVLRVTGLGRTLAQDISKGLNNLNIIILRDETTVKQSVELIIKKAYGDSHK